MWTIRTRSKLFVGQPRIVGRAEPDADIVEPLARDARRPARRAPRATMSCASTRPSLPDALREADRVIALARADIGDGHARRDRRRGPSPRRPRCSRSRASSFDQRAETIGATGRSAAGKRVRLARSALAQRGCAPSHAASSERREQRQAAARRASIDILHLDLLAGHALRQRRRHEGIESPSSTSRRRGRGDAGAQILHQLIGLEDVAADLVAPADVGLGWRSRRWPPPRASRSSRS